MGGGHVTFAISAAAGAEAALQHRDAVAAVAANGSTVTGSHSPHSTAVTAAGAGPGQPSAQRPQPHHSALRHPAHQQQQPQPQQQQRPWSSMPTVKLADYTSNRSGVHQVSLCM